MYSVEIYFWNKNCWPFLNYYAKHYAIKSIFYLFTVFCNIGQSFPLQTLLSCSLFTCKKIENFLCLIWALRIYEQNPASIQKTPDTVFQPRLAYALNVFIDFFMVNEISFLANIFPYLLSIYCILKHKFLKINVSDNLIQVTDIPSIVSSCVSLGVKFVELCSKETHQTPNCSLSGQCR